MKRSLWIALITGVLICGGCGDDSSVAIPEQFAPPPPPGALETMDAPAPRPLKEK